MTRWFDNYTRMGLILFGLAIVIMAMLLATNRGDLTSATLLLIAFTCFFTGLIIFSMRSEEGRDQKLAAYMAVPYTSTFSRILADLGVQGNAHFITGLDDRMFSDTVMQFNPVTGAIPSRLPDNQCFYIRKDSPGILTVPSGSALLAMMERDKAITSPSSEPELFAALKEINEDLLEIADSAKVTRSGDEIIVELKNFGLIEGCIKIRDESPQNCITAPCPVCSLAGIMIAQCLGKTCVMREAMVDKEAGKVEIHIGVKEPV
jgi:Ca2+/Na+ antiporter